MAKICMKITKSTFRGKTVRRTWEDKPILGVLWGSNGHVHVRNDDQNIVQRFQFVDSNHTCSLGDFLWLNYLSLLQAHEKVNSFPLTMAGNENLQLTMEGRQITWMWKGILHNETSLFL